MDFSARGPQQNGAAGAPAAAQGPAAGAKKPAKTKANALKVWGTSILGLLVLVLVVALIVVIGFGGAKPESSYVKNDKLQAVFLQTGQVYFGNISKLNNNYLVLNDIYYLQTSGSSSTSSTSSNANVSLVKLGCELHEPYDQMVINRDQVTFWENLEDGGQVAKAVATFQKDNPNGQKCSDQSAAPNGNVQGTDTTNNSTDTTNQ